MYSPSLGQRSPPSQSHQFSRLPEPGATRTEGPYKTKVDFIRIGRYRQQTAFTKSGGAESGGKHKPTPAGRSIEAPRFRATQPSQSIRANTKRAEEGVPKTRRALPRPFFVLRGPFQRLSRLPLEGPLVPKLEEGDRANREQNPRVAAIAVRETPNQYEKK